MSSPSPQRQALEAALFMSPKPIDTTQLARFLGIAAIGMVENELLTLKKEYEERQSAIEVYKEGSKWGLRLKQELQQTAIKFAKESELSPKALKVLAYVSKHDGITKSFLVKKLGPYVYDAVKELDKKEFITQKPNKQTKSLFITQKFKDYFGTTV